MANHLVCQNRRRVHASIAKGRQKMSKKKMINLEQVRETASVSRRDFIKQGMAAGVCAATLAGCVTAPSAQDTNAGSTKWDYEVELLSLVLGRLDCRARSGRAMQGYPYSSSIRTSISAARCCTAAVRFRSAAATPASCVISLVRATGKDLSKCRRCTNRRR